MNTIQEYIEQFDAERQSKLWEMYHIIKEACPQASEKISWQMPTFYWHGNLVHFALHQHHIGLYPGASGVVFYQTLNQDYTFSKGTIQFPLHQELPKDVIQAIVRFRYDENEQSKRE